jgi:H/ACA ribonucleoprotein complex non-core subunit NAF1
MPSITSVEPSEAIELIGEVLSIVDSVVVVKSYEHGQYKVLDTDSLVVLEDRKVFGLVRPTRHLLVKGFRVIIMFSCPRFSRPLAL